MLLWEGTAAAAVQGRDRRSKSLPPFPAFQGLSLASPTVRDVHHQPEYRTGLELGTIIYCLTQGHRKIRQSFPTFTINYLWYNYIMVFMVQLYYTVYILLTPLLISCVVWMSFFFLSFHSFPLFICRRAIILHLPDSDINLQVSNKFSVKPNNFGCFYFYTNFPLFTPLLLLFKLLL